VFGFWPAAKLSVLALIATAVELAPKPITVAKPEVLTVTSELLYDCQVAVLVRSCVLLSE